MERCRQAGGRANRRPHDRRTAGPMTALRRTRRARGPDRRSGPGGQAQPARAAQRHQPRAAPGPGRTLPADRCRRRGPGRRADREREGVLGRRRLHLPRRAGPGPGSPQGDAGPRPPDRHRHGGLSRAHRGRGERPRRRPGLQPGRPLRHRVHGREHAPGRSPCAHGPGGGRRRPGDLAAHDQPAAGQGVRVDRRPHPGQAGRGDRPRQPRLPRRRGGGPRRWPVPTGSPSCPGGPSRTPSASSTCTSSGRSSPPSTSP